MPSFTGYIHLKKINHNYLVRKEIFSHENLIEYAKKLSTEHTITSVNRSDSKLLNNLLANAESLRKNYTSIIATLNQAIEMSPAAEWIADNYFVAEEHIRNIRNDLPTSFYRTLPKLMNGDLAGFPRIYALATAYIAHTDSYFNPELLTDFIQAYQKNCPLTIGELWAIPIGLRTALVDNLARAAQLVVDDRSDRWEADTLVDALLKHNNLTDAHIKDTLKEIDQANLGAAGIVQLIQRLRDQDEKSLSLLQSLETALQEAGSSAAEIVSSEHNNQGALTVTVRNIITSMRAIATFDWVTLFETVSHVDQSLRANSQFARMDLPTRNLYRRAIEKLARQSDKSELFVTEAALELVRQNTHSALNIDSSSAKITEAEIDAGYYLLGDGRAILQKQIGYRPDFLEMLRQQPVARKFVAYLITAMMVVIGIIQLGLAGTVSQTEPLWKLLIISAAVFFPAWEAAITLVNRASIYLFSPSILPSLSLRDGIPDTLRTAVVIPILLTSETEAAELVKQLEVHYLANADDNLRFCLLSDWRDADQEISPADMGLFSYTAEAIAALNQRYPLPNAQPRFFFFHRRRQWNDTQKIWMGWERKRGKLHELNRLLRNKSDTSFMNADSASAIGLPDDIRFVVTLDADTRLPIGAVRRLIGKMAHPLNQAHFDAATGSVTKGYGILQPRVSSALPKYHADSFFQRVFYRASGMDPYAFAISDVYQDVFAEGSFTGKGIYDVDAFEKSMAERIPPNAVLSHDLIEGIFARAGLVSDIEVIEEYPSRYDVASIRQHRWARGDWQLLPWIFGARSHNVPSLGHWKMLDNLRRTLTAPATFVALLLGWGFSFASASLWTFLIIVAYSMPLFLHMIETILPRRSSSLTVYLTNLGNELLRTFQQIFFCFVFLPHQAWLMLDAIFRTLWRLTISHRNLLEWKTASEAARNAGDGMAGFFWSMRGGLYLTCLALIWLLCLDSVIWFFAAPFLVLWLAAPMLAYYSSLPVTAFKTKTLAESDKQELRQIARETWHYFETFVTADENWLPPDNFQEDPYPVVAHRTSPTNIGLYFLASISAYDLGWQNGQQLLVRLKNSFGTLQRMQRFRGHLFNWYDTLTLTPLEPRYISTVDSGNLAGYFLVVAQFSRAISQQSVWHKAWGQGLSDTHSLLSQVFAEHTPTINSTAFTQAQQNLAAMMPQLKQCQSDNLLNSYIALQTMAKQASAIQDLCSLYKSECGDKVSRADEHLCNVSARFSAMLANQFALCLYAMPWLGIMAKSQVALNNHDEAMLAHLTSPLLTWQNLADFAGKHSAAIAVLSSQLLQAAIHKGAANAQLFLQDYDQLANMAATMFKEMDFSFLLNKQRKILSIGMRVADETLDDGCYDLLASEARLGTLIAIAKGDIAPHCWFRLGRTVTKVGARPALVSWSGSMFEYLMPALIMREPEASLIGQTNQLIVQRQIEYGRLRDIPWGVSESAYNARDYEMTYQYSGFGIPGLGLKRGLSENVVIAPYATGLAAMVDPMAALANYKHLTSIGGRGCYGWYEAIDFTPKRLPKGVSHIVVKAYMAHHQGMTIVALHDVISNGVMRDLFHNDALIQAADLLLQELPPSNVALSEPRFEEVKTMVPARAIRSSHPRQFSSPHTATPQAHLLANGNYSVMITAAGGGYSQCNGLAVTRWREDSTRDYCGSFVYIRPTDSHNYWSAAYQPVGKSADTYQAMFHEDYAEFQRQDGLISTSMNVVVSPEDAAEVRHITLTNHGEKDREIELTSYAELVLTLASSDAAHPAFAKMFVITEFLPHARALLATRRPRQHDEKPLWAAHILATNAELVGELQYETDRARFLGIGHTLRAPIAMDGRPLSDTTGTVLDPVFSLRGRVRLAPHMPVEVSFWTLVADSREELVRLVDKYRTSGSYSRAIARAWTLAQLQFQYLSMTPDEARLFQQLASALIYTNRAMRAKPQTIIDGAAAQSVLWSTGISGDVPILLLRVDKATDMKSLRQLVKAHGYISMKGLDFDLVILNEQPTSYLEPLQQEMDLLIRTRQSLPGAYGKQGKGSIHVLRGDQINSDARKLLFAVARVVLHSHRGSLAEQIERLPLLSSPPFVVHIPAIKHSPALAALPAALELEFFNGIGGFASDDREYVVVLSPSQNTPAPWINVIANPHFGFHVAADGAGYSWSGNSREHKLTPWSNDPVSNQTGEAIYLMDTDSRQIWSLAAAPIRHQTATYVTHHGMGYSVFKTEIGGIRSEVTQFVPVNDTIKITRIRLTNQSSVTKQLQLTSYHEWLLGVNELTAGNVICTSRNPVTGTLYARNPWTEQAATAITFVHLSGDTARFTCDREEFLGRHGDYANPAGLHKPLSGRVGAGMESCAALASTITLRAGETREICLLLGTAETLALADDLVKKYTDNAIQPALLEVQNYWQHLTQQIQVRTPDRATDIMLNGWLLYQTVVCRIWARSAFYQTSGAYGYRDQLQDVMTTVHAQPAWTRQHILRAASRQFIEGDVQHWWLPSAHNVGKGVRTRFADDMLWLPYVTAYYIRTTGDHAVLDEMVPFLQAPLLTEEQHEVFGLPEISNHTASLRDHCVLAINRSLTKGAHGLSLIGGGDWNDGMNRVGIGGQGESVWLSWFLITTIQNFTAADHTLPMTTTTPWQEHCSTLATAIEDNAWDGEWYRRGYYDDGTPLGSAVSDECRIDSIAQSWAIISGAANPERAAQAMQAVERHLHFPEEGLALLFKPPFNNTAQDPGYIKSYPPGLRENGGQYTHAALWSVLAFSKTQQTEKAFQLFSMINPIQHALSRTEAFRYKVEPYVVAADIYSNPQHRGRGGWTWYTGSAGWMYRIGLEAILGLDVRGNQLFCQPCIPQHWPRYEITYRYHSSTYHIEVENLSGKGHGVVQCFLDGQEQQATAPITMVDDGAEHHVKFVL